MLRLALKLAQVGITVFWLAMVLSLTSIIPAPYSGPIIWIGTAVLLIHLSEYFLMRNRIRGEQNTDINFFSTMLFGVAYWLPLLTGYDKQRSNQRSQEPAA